MRRDEHPLTETPVLERQLRRLRSSLVILVLLHGIGTVLAVGAAWLVFAFLADWGLHVPRPVRLLHASVFVALSLFFAWRELVRPLARIPDRAGLAVLLERGVPTLRELLVSAVQLQAPGMAASESSGHVEAVCRDADARAAGLELAPVLDRRGPMTRLLAGLSCVGVTAVLLAVSTAHARIFFQRMLGSEIPWPRRTNLELELPNLGDVDVDPGEIVARVSRGSDVLVLVRARGVAPEEVTLNFSDGTKEFLARGSGGTYRCVLRAVRDDLELYVTGGDDDDRDPLMRLVVLQPPDVSGIAVLVRPPPYTGIPEELVFNRDVDVLAGSELSIHVRVDPPDARGSARVLPDDRVLALVPAPFPAEPEALDPESPGAPLQRDGLAFHLTAERSIRYRFELRDASGLTNPDPGLFAVQVIPDRAPEVQVLSPGRADVETVAGGAISLRARVKDDFGITGIAWRTIDTRGTGGETPATSATSVPEERAGGALEWRTATEDPFPERRADRVVVAGGRLSIAQMFGDVAEGSQYTVEVVATDNREPTPSEGRSSEIRIRIVSADELLRRIQDRLARLRIEASELADLQTEKRHRVDELIEALGSDALVEAGDSRALSSLLTGQRRVQGDAESVARELAAIADTVLYARLDDKAGALLERLDARMSNVFDKSFRPDVWTELHAEYASGSLGSAGLAGNLIEILGVALQIGDTHARLAAAALERAQNSVDFKSIRTALEECAREQKLALARIEDLLERLAEWDSFQSVLTLSRDILNRQSVLRQRTQRFASEK